MNVHSSLKKGTKLKQAVQDTGGMSPAVTQSVPPSFLWPGASNLSKCYLNWGYFRECWGDLTLKEITSSNAGAFSIKGQIVKYFRLCRPYHLTVITQFC